MLAAAGAAGSPFLTYYAQETRMYSLVVLLSILASASFALAFVRGERRHVAYLGVWLALLLYTHTWGLFMAAAMGAVWLHLRRRGEVEHARTACASASCSRSPTCRGCRSCSSRPRTPPRRGPSDHRRSCC